MRIALLCLLACSASAFIAPLPAFSPKIVSTTARHIIMSDKETESLLGTAEYCLDHEQCSVDSVKVLIDELKDTEKLLNDRLVKVMNMIAHLQDINSKKERKTDEVRQLVKDMLRVFSHEKQYPGGFSGDIGDGPTDAYKALEPKPWKPSKSA